MAEKKTERPCRNVRDTSKMTYTCIPQYMRALALMLAPVDK